MTHAPLDWIAGALDDLERRGLRRTRRRGVGADHAVVNFGSNDYLGLAADPRLAEAAREATARDGWGAGASPAVCGRSEVHERLETALAEFEGAEAALLFPSGYAANSGVIPTLVDDGDAIYADAKNHASLIDGCRLARARRFIYPHADTASLAALLADGRGFRRRLIVTDTLFSMDGDFAPLAAIAELAERHDAMVLVDEAHATGVWGPSGRGAAEGAPGRAAMVRVGTLSKALGSAGGFVAGSSDLVDWIANRARPHVYSTACPPAVAAAALAALRIVRDEPGRRERLAALAERFRRAVVDQGWSIGTSTSQIVPIDAGEPEAAMALAGRLLEAGCYAPAIRPPSVPEGESLVRVSLSAAHSDADVDRLLGALQAARPGQPAPGAPRAADSGPTG